MVTVLLSISTVMKSLFIVIIDIFILGGYPPLTLSDLLASWWTYLIETSPCRLLSSLRLFVMNKFMWPDYQRNTSYKQISRII